MRSTLIDLGVFGNFLRRTCSLRPKMLANTLYLCYPYSARADRPTVWVTHHGGRGPKSGGFMARLRTSGASRRAKGRHRKTNERARHLEVSAWLGSGAITLGIGAALASGVGVAHADEGSSGSSSSASPSDGQPKGLSSNSPSESTTAVNNQTTTSVAATSKLGSSPGSSSDTKPKASKTEKPVSTVSSSGGRVKPTATKAEDSNAAGADDASVTVHNTLTVTTAVKKAAPIQSLNTEANTTDYEPASVHTSTTVTGTAATTAIDAPPTTPVAITAVVEGSTARTAAGTTSSGTGPAANIAIRTLALTTSLNTVDPARAAYLKQFKDADPNDLYATPASAGYVPPTPPNFTDDQYRQFVADGVAKTGTTGFSLTSNGALQYANTHNQNVAVLYATKAAGYAEPSGIRIVRPGQTVVLPAPPQGAVAEAQLPKSNGQLNEVAVAAVGYPPFTKPAAVPITQQLANALNAVAVSVNSALVSITNQVNATIQLAAARVNSVIVSIAVNAGNVAAAFGAGGLPNAIDYLNTVNSLNPIASKSGAPTSTGALYSTLRGVTKGDTDGIVVEKIAAADGNRYIVYLGGTDLLSTTNQPFVKNLPSYLGKVDNHQVNVIRAALGNDTNAKIMLVGYSQGGLDAQNIATNQKSLGLHVTTVVTYGTPIIITAPAHTDFLIGFIQDDKDSVVNLSNNKNDLTSNRNAGNVYTAASSSDRDIAQINKDFFYVHGAQKTYVELGNRFDSIGYPVEANIQKFKGTVTTIYGATKSSIA
jgi:hypothetical protein